MEVIKKVINFKIFNVLGEGEKLVSWSNDVCTNYKNPIEY